MLKNFITIMSFLMEKEIQKGPAQKLNQQHPKKSLHKIIIYKTESKPNCDE
jgi:hypothetical protein